MIFYSLNSSYSRAFTLIELLVVISIIGLLSSVVLSSLNSVRAKARDSVRLSELNQVSKALMLYFNDHNLTYPAPNYCAAWYHTWSGWDANSCGNAVTPGLVQTSDNGVLPYLNGYITQFQDPIFNKTSNSTRTYYYCVDTFCPIINQLGGGGGKHYVLMTILENPSDGIMQSSLVGQFYGSLNCGVNGYYCIGQ